MRTTTDICIIGGGPAGSVLATRLAQFGWAVCLVERARFPRRHLGESLSPGVIPLLASIGAGPAIEEAGYPRVRSVSVNWEAPRQREDPGGQGMLVDRGHFDRLLLEHARGCGVRILQPATVEKFQRCAGGWSMAVSEEGRLNEMEVRFLADASGRAGVLRRRRSRTGPRTLALHAYWKGVGLPQYPRIEAGADQWFWGVPLPDGLYNTLVFLDPRNLRAMPGTLEARFHELIARSSLLPSGVNAKLVGRIEATDATPYFDEDCVTEDSIKVGDAALAVDPLSSSGVQKAIQSALAGSVVVNTLLQRPRAQALARQFYRENLSEASTRHRAWASGHYAQVAAHRTARFWRERAEVVFSPEIAPPRAEIPVPLDAPLRLSPGVEFVELPCVVDRFIEVRSAVHFPPMGSPVAYLGDLELAPLLRCVRSGMTPREMARSWMPWAPPPKGLAIAQWLISRGLLVPNADVPLVMEEERPMTRTLGEWLKAHDLAEFEPVFVENQVDLKTLEVLTEPDLKELGLAFGPRKRLLSAIAELKRQLALQRAEIDMPAAGGAFGERRQLTVMFCDLVGSTSLSTLLDPEELRELIQAYRKACRDVLIRYDGYVAQYLGDGLMVYFGWPTAHEDDVERGVRSALEMVRAVREITGAYPLATRIGLATGTVVVSQASSTDTSGEKTALGDVPNLAARLQAVAGPHEVVIAPTTHRLLPDAFSLTDLGEHSLKGIPQPVQVWRVDDVRRTEGRFKIARGGIDPAPLLGRDEESTLLACSWQRARSGEGQVVLIGGQPGIGKSRLTEGLREGITEPHTALRYQCSPYHLNSPLHPFIEQFEISAGFARDDTPEEQLGKMEAALMDSATQSAESAALFAALLSLPMERYPPLRLSPRKQKEKTFEALVGRVVALCSKSPVLMMLEDAHWIDPTSHELLEILVPKLREMPVLMVITYRLEYEPLWAGQPGVTTLTLHRLARREGAELVNTLTKGRALPMEVLDEILTRTDGVPLFIEELTRSVLESGLLREEGDHYALQAPLASLAIPVSLRDSLMARLDRLGPVKEFAQIGACIGREFSYELLKRISTLRAESLEASLEKLVETGLVTRRDLPPDATYTFKHALIQDAAYDSLLKTRRVELHARIAHVLENDFADLATDEPAWLAHHHTQAGNLTTAIPLWRKAGALAVGRVALKEAVAHFQKGLVLVDLLPPSKMRDGLELTIREPLNAAWTGLRGWAAPEVGVNAAAILRLAEDPIHAQSLLLALWWVWTSTITQGRIADSRQWVERLLAEGSADGDVDLQIFGHATAMVQHFLSGQLVESREETDRALALWDPRRAERWIELTGHDLRSFVKVYACQLLWMMGFPDQAARLSDESVADARSDGHAFNLVWALTFSAYVFAYRREPARFLERVDEADRLAREQGLAFIYEVSVPQARGMAELQNGRPREAISLLRQGIDRWTKTGGNVRIPLLKSALAEAVALEGDPGAALGLIDECLEQIERPSGQERLWLAEVLRRKGWILMRLHRDDEAEVQLRAAIECARRQQAKSWELRSATSLATLFARRGQREAARDLLAPVFEWFTEGADTKDLVEARVLLERLAS